MSGEPLGVRLAALGRSAASDLRRRLQAFDLDPRQYRVLAATARCGDCSQRSLAEQLRIPASRVVAIVDDLESRGLIERHPQPADRRAHALRLTSAGARLVEAATPVVEGQAEDLLAGLDGEERAALLALLSHLEGCC